MADLTFLYEEDTIATVDKAVALKAQSEPPRGYLGMSEIGDECVRRLWIKYHAAPIEEFSGRMHRLFDTGHLIEARVVRDLRLAGLKVNRSAKANSYSDFDGLFRGHSDGRITGLKESSKTHILEVKSASDKRFNEFKKNGIESDAKYFAQAQLYMGYAKLVRCLFVIENKNTSERIQERVKFDRALFERLREKARLIIESKEPPRGISDRVDWFQCRMCNLNNENYCRKDWSDGKVPF